VSSAGTNAVAGGGSGTAGTSGTGGASGGTGGASGGTGGASGGTGGASGGTGGASGGTGGASGGTGGASGGTGGASGGTGGAGAGGKGGTGGGGAGGKGGTGGGGGGGAGGSGGAAGHGGTGGTSAGAGGTGGSSGAAGGTGGAAGSGGSGGSGGIIGKMYTLNRFVIGSSAASATVNVTWNATKIEFVFVVQDATPEDDSALNYQDDAAEIYLDLNNGKTATFQADDCEIVIPRLTGTVDGVGLSTAQYAAITVQRTSNGATGYTLDVSVPWSALNIGAPPLGQTIGINLAVDDDTNGVDRDAQLMLSGDQFAYNNPSAWASLLLN
jgi:hypothetical protein